MCCSLTIIKLLEVLAKLELLSATFVLFATATFAQNISVNGSISDYKGALIGASVSVDGTQQGTVTELDGTFNLPNVPSNGVLTFSFIGYKSQSLPIQSRKTYDIVLEEDLTSLDEVVVVGYEVKKKSVVTGAIGSIDSDDLLKAKPANAVNALSGRVSGVNVVSSSGNPGASPKLVIRGIGTSGDSDPLYVVDGLQLSNLDNINPNDIASMEVLKDATSTAIYGSRGANGVVLVTTKKGSKGKTTISYDGYYGVSSVFGTTELMNSEQYVDYIYAVHERSGSKMPSTMALDTSVNTNWMEEIFNVAPVQQHNVTFTTGSEKGSSATSIGYLDQEGILGGQFDKSGYQRFTVRSNNAYKVNNYLSAGANINVAYTSKQSMGTGGNGSNPIQYAMSMEPTIPVTGGSSVDEWGYSISQTGYIKSVNPLAYMESRADADNGSTTIYGNAYLEVTPIEGLVIRSNLSANVGNTYNRSYSSDFYHNSSLNIPSSVTNYSAKSIGWQLENTALYRKSFNDHNFSFLLGQSALASSSQYLNASRSNIASEAEANEYYRYIDGGDISTSTNSGAAYATHSMQSFFGRLSYNYKERYMAEFVVRRDGSSNFGAGNKYGTFPGVSLGWNVSNEDFWDVDNFDGLKVRASWGQNGNESIDQFSYTSIISSDYNYVFGNNIISGAAPTSMSNSAVTWETSEQIDLGVDMMFFGGKLTTTFDYFDKTTKDLLFTPTMSAVYGNNIPYYNIGQISNKGVEFMVSYRNNIGDFHYNISANASYLDTNVDYIDNENGYVEGGSWRSSTEVTRLEEGCDIGYFFLYKHDGIFQSQEEIDNYVGENGTPIQPNAVPGDYRWIDADGDGIITEADRVDCGNPWAKWTWGTSIGFDYKGFDFTMQLVAKTGFQVFADMTQNGMIGYGNLPTFLMDSWSETNTDAKYARLTTSTADTNNNYILPTDAYLFDGDYLNISLMEFGYSLPKHIINKAKIANLRIYVSVDNLARFQSYPYMNSDISAQSSSDILETGIDYGGYPLARTTRIGANITF
ncbi:MAG: TonB-dependent receptor [Rikenellaceae bacterium]